MDHVDPEKRDKWLAELETALPWQVNREPSEEQLAREFAGFAALLGSA